MIKTRGLSKKFKKKLAVDNVSFEVETGKVTGFLGPNGAGKSTTMRLMLGLDNGRGNTTYDGKKLAEYKKPSSIVGILLEAKAFHPTRSARNHLKVLAASGGIPDKRVDEVLDMVGLKQVAKKKPGKFSLGMSQRLGIAAAILGEPKYLILDEPANGLDPEGIKWLRDFLKDYAKDSRGVFVSSHLLSEMSLMAENVIVIGRGKLIADTSIKKLVSKDGQSGVFVRSTEPKKLTDLLKSSEYKFEKQDDGFLVHKTKTDDLGRLLHSKNLTVLELSNQSASLEEVFFELTSGSQEYKTHKEKADKK